MGGRRGCGDLSRGPVDGGGAGAAAIETPHGSSEVRDLRALGLDVSEEAIRAAQGRIGTPQEVARAAPFLASDEASFVNGTHLFVESGFTAI